MQFKYLKILFSFILLLKSINPHVEAEEACKKHLETQKDDDCKDQMRKEENKKNDNCNKDDNDKDLKKYKDNDDINDCDEETPPKIGNFSLPASQQPFGLFAFGGNIIDVGEVQTYLFADEFIGSRKTLIEVIPNVIFGVTSNFSVMLAFPFAPYFEEKCDRSSGLQDFFIQLEYAFWNKSTRCYQDQATLTLNLAAPTGSFRKKPPTGFGSPSVFLGATYTHMTPTWFFFACEGAILTTSFHHNKTGDHFLYQLGFGRNFPSPQGWIYAWMLEIDGEYFKKNLIHGHFDTNSGGNIILATPSLWMSSNEFLVQIGASFPINQNLFGNQKKIDYILNVNIAWSFESKKPLKDNKR
jgi:hypothetical protein